MNNTRSCLLLVLFALFCGQSAHAVDAKVQAIFLNMAKLGSLVGKWKADIDFYDRDGKLIKETADYSVHPTLDGTYLEADVSVWRNDDASKRHGFKIMTTFNPDTGKYDQTYFYSRWAIRVTETGEFDDASQEYRTTAFIPLEDGKHDESVHTTTKFQPNGSVEYWHWSRYDNETTALMNFHAVLKKMHS